MCNTGWLKRMLPFLAAFTLGVFIASFFVSVGPRFGLNDRRMKRFQEMQRLRFENDQLREENDRLRNNLGQRGMDSGDQYHSWTPESLDAPLPPPLPRPAPRVSK